MTNIPAAPAGWYPDPAGGEGRRWWDGATWTEHREQPYSPAAAAAALRAPEGTRTNTPWIWLIAVLPVLSFIPLLTIDWPAYLANSMAAGGSIYGQSALYTSPGYLAATVLGWVIYAVCALFAYLDWKRLAAAGVPRPFHFAWVFLSSIVYVIGRSVVVRRRTGTGAGPMWVSIAVIALSLAISVYLVATIIGAAIDQVQQVVNR